MYSSGKSDEKIMRKLFFIFFIVLLLSSCAPVLRPDIMDKAIREFSLSEIKNDPEPYKRKMFVLGGSIINTKLTEKGSQIEALYVPVDSRGHLKDVEPSSLDGRFLAIFPKESGILDPVIYRKGRDITVAGEFLGTESGKIDEAEYIYPVFEIIQIYLWKERQYYPYYYPYPYYYAYPYWWYDPWWRPWGPWWGYYPRYWW